MSIGHPTIFKSLWWAEQAALTTDPDCLPSAAAEAAVKRTGGSFDVAPVRRLICAAAENLSLANNTRTAANALNIRATSWNVLDDISQDDIRRLFREIRRLLNLRFRGR